MRLTPKHSVFVSRREGESWRQAAERIGAQNGLAREVCEAYDAAIRRGCDEPTAAWAACYDWGVRERQEAGE